MAHTFIITIIIILHIIYIHVCVCVCVCDSWKSLFMDSSHYLHYLLCSGTIQWAINRLPSVLRILLRLLIERWIPFYSLPGTLARPLVSIWLHPIANMMGNESIHSRGLPMDSLKFFCQCWRIMRFFRFHYLLIEFLEIFWDSSPLPNQLYRFLNSDEMNDRSTWSEHSC